MSIEAGLPTGPGVGTSFAPHGPKALPILGHLFSLGKDTFGFLEQCEREYGEAVSLMLGAGWPTLMFNSSELIEQVLVKQHMSFSKNSRFWRQVTALFGTGLLTSDGALWQRQRKLAAPAFAGQRLLSYAPAMVGAAERTLADWRDGQVVDIYPESMVLTLRVASKTLFNSDVDTEVAEMGEAMDQISDEIRARFTRPFLLPDSLPLPGHKRYRRGIEHVEKVVDRILAQRRSGDPDKGDFLSMLMLARDESGEPMSDKQLRDEAVTLLLAGHETTALSMSWALLLLSRSLETQDKVAAELDAVVGDRQIREEDLASLPFLEAVVMESMRLYPPVWVIGREAKEDVQIRDIKVPRGTSVLVSAWVVQRSARNFEAPTEFRPERWAGDFRRKLPRYAYFPFGGGPRICIGMRFAMMETMLILGTLLSRYRMVATNHDPVEKIGSITLRPKNGVWVTLQERRKALAA